MTDFIYGSVRGQRVMFVDLTRGLRLSTEQASLPHSLEQYLSLPSSTGKFFADLVSVTYLCALLPV